MSGHCNCVSVLNTSLCCLESRPVIDLFNDDDADDEGDIFKQMSSRPAADQPANTAAKHKVCCHYRHVDGFCVP